MSLDYDDLMGRRIVEEALDRLGWPEGPQKEQKHRELENQRAVNRQAREAHRAALAAEQAAERQRREAEHDARLEPAKRRLRREWLATQTESDERVFEQKVWPLLKANLLEDQRAELVKKTQEQLKATGMYSL